jgi:hypothetical protein
MVTMDQKLNAAPKGWQGRWQHPRLLLLLGVLALGLSLNSAVTGGSLGNDLQWDGLSLFSRADAADGGPDVLAPAVQVSGQRQICGRMRYIVETSCGLRQLDHDAEGFRRCISRELKYTMWSAYGCA